MSAHQGLQAELTTQAGTIASGTYNGSRYFAGMPSNPIQDADLERGERIRVARERLGLNQSELGRKMSPKVSPQTVQQWEKGGGIRGKNQRQLATVLQITPEELMFGNVNVEAEPSHANDDRHARVMRLDGATVATAFAAIEWRLALVNMKYDLAKAPEALAAALNWTVDKSPENLHELQAVLEAEIRRQQGEKRASPQKDQLGSAGGIGEGDRTRKPASRGQ